MIVNTALFSFFSYVLLIPILVPVVLTTNPPNPLEPPNEGDSTSSATGSTGPIRDTLGRRPSLAREGSRLSQQLPRPPGSPPRTSGTLPRRDREIICHQGVWDLQEHTKNTQPFETDCRGIYNELTRTSPMQRRTSRGDYWWYKRRDYCQITVVLLPGEALQSALASQLKMQDSIWQLVLDAMRGILTRCVEARGLGGYYLFNEEKAKFKVTIGESPPLMVYEEDEQTQPLLGSPLTYQPSSSIDPPAAGDMAPPRQEGGMNRLPIFRNSGGSMTRTDWGGSFSDQRQRSASPGAVDPLSQAESGEAPATAAELQTVWDHLKATMRACCNSDLCGCCNSPCWNDPITWARVSVALNLFAAAANAFGNSMNVAAAAQNLRAIAKKDAACPPCPAPPPIPDLPGV